MNIVLNNVRLSYPQLFKPKAFNPADEPTYGAVFLMDKEDNAEDIEKYRKGVKAVATAHWGEEIPPGVKFSLRDGSEREGSDGYGKHMMFLSAGNRKAVPIVDLNPNIVLTESDGRPYAGCYVNASIRLWVQDNTWGKRVNSQLQAVQFAMDGDPFGAVPVDPANTFKNNASTAAADFPGSSENKPKQSLDFL